jgi:hypothetical protein
MYGNLRSCIFWVLSWCSSVQFIYTKFMSTAWEGWRQKQMGLKIYSNDRLSCRWTTPKWRSVINWSQISTITVQSKCWRCIFSHQTQPIYGTIWLSTRYAYRFHTNVNPKCIQGSLVHEYCGHLCSFNILFYIAHISKLHQFYIPHLREHIFKTPGSMNKSSSQEYFQR